MSKDQLEELIVQIVDGAIQTIPAYVEEIEQNKSELKVENTKEFVFGIIMGMALGIASMVATASQDGILSNQDQIKIKEIIYSKIPIIRERIFT